jgi:hypothetical protein
MPRKIIFILVLAVILSACGTAPATVTVVAPATVTPAPTFTPSPTATSTPVPPTITPSPTPTFIPTATPFPDRLAALGCFLSQCQSCKGGGADLFYGQEDKIESFFLEEFDTETYTLFLFSELTDEKLCVYGSVNPREDGGNRFLIWIGLDGEVEVVEYLPAN